MTTQLYARDPPEFRHHVKGAAVEQPASASPSTTPTPVPSAPASRRGSASGNAGLGLGLPAVHQSSPSSVNASSTHLSSHQQQNPLRQAAARFGARVMEFSESLTNPRDEQRSAQSGAYGQVRAGMSRVSSSTALEPAARIPGAVAPLASVASSTPSASPPTPAHRPSRVRFPIATSRGVSARDAATSSIPSAWPPSYNLNAADPSPYLPPALRYQPFQPGSSIPTEPADTKLKFDDAVTSAFYELSVKFWLTPIWKFQFPSANFADPNGATLFDFAFKQMAGSGSLSWEMRSEHAQGPMAWAYSNKKERLYSAGGQVVKCTVGRVNPGSRWKKRNAVAAAAKSPASLHAQIQAAQHKFQQHQQGQQQQQQAALQRTQSAEEGSQLHRSLSRGSTATQAQLSHQSRQLRNVYPVRHRRPAAPPAPASNSTYRPPLYKRFSTRGRPSSKGSAGGQSAEQPDDRQALPMEEEELLSGSTAGGDMMASRSSADGREDDTLSITSDRTTRSSTIVEGGRPESMVYDYCEFSIPGEQGGRWTWVSNRPMRSIDGLRFDTVQMALIEHRQPQAPDVVIANFSMIDEMSEANWKLCMRTSPRSPLHKNHALIMATLMILYRKSWTLMSAEAQANRGRVKASLEAASLSSAGYVNYQLDRSGEVKYFLNRGFRPPNRNRGQAGAAAGARGTRQAEEEEEEERASRWKPPLAESCSGGSIANRQHHPLARAY